MTCTHVLLLPPARDDGVPVDDGLIDARQADRADGGGPDSLLGELDTTDMVLLGRI